MSDPDRFVVRRIDWARSEYGEPYARRTPRTERVAAFDTFDAAEDDRAAREAAERARANPFWYGGESLFYQTSLDAPRLHDWLMDVGIDPPAAPQAHAGWAAWWDTAAPTWSAEQLAHAWKAFDKIQFFEVSERRSGPKGYVIVELHWKWEDESTLEADYEGGLAVRAFRSRERAEAECARLNLERQSRPDHNGYSSFTRSTRYGGETEGPRGMADTLFFEVVEIDLGDDA
ncbi:hypothetical protein GobsT_19110 [Gemmata obscuriglobus]|uniref:Uncharacterized protein n=1 Tax=Gemmata obscuriglobus TaxID=114 RepID=A0A2Z3HEM3_9BACT|nr:hypothetical protein [Gemmata obscuriglobus]AWM39730.1 hypothetical protein C1280_23830 [Gemmata obscuriglobus]QEG27157.1 hypothetical protein GobsT_19110 [Gemmata obscuriglobus]VTS03769.1 unnamed protein product [Gemmata obscuriglobus UQM 2246]